MQKFFFFSMPSFAVPGMIGLLLALSGVVTIAQAQEPTATISSMNGTVLVTIQGQDGRAATVGETLQTGDMLETQAGASVVLVLSEGSELKIGQNTKIDIAQLARRPKTKARTSRIKLLYGKFRAFLSPGHQKEDAAFEIETPNAMAGVKFSLPEVFISYDSNTETTLVDAVTVDMEIRNLITKEIKRLPTGYRAIVKGDTIEIFPIPEAELSSRYHFFFLEARDIVKGMTGNVPSSVGPTGPTTGAAPNPGGRPRRDPVPRTITIHLEEDLFR